VKGLFRSKKFTFTLSWNTRFCLRKYFEYAKKEYSLLEDRREGKGWLKIPQPCCLYLNWKKEKRRCRSSSFLR
jgi:hypothetical protein